MTLINITSSQDDTMGGANVNYSIYLMTIALTKSRNLITTSTKANNICIDAYINKRAYLSIVL